MLIALNKPFGVLCQFSDRAGTAAGLARRTLAELVPVPGVYPAGRLDADSEGLLLLTDDGPMAAQITDPKHAWAKTYLTQVDGIPDEAALQRLRHGLELNDGPTRPAQVRLLAKAPGWLWKRDPPIRQRKHQPTAWLEIVLREGRNRQVRRMTAAVGLPTLRLIRCQIGPYPLGTLTPGRWRRIA